MWAGFGCPLRLNGKEMRFWFNGIPKNADVNVVEFYEFGVTDVAKKEAVDAVASATSADEGSSAASEGTLGEVLSRVKNKEVVDVKKWRRVRGVTIDDLRLTICDSLACALARGGCEAKAEPNF